MAMYVKVVETIWGVSSSTIWFQGLSSGHQVGSVRNNLRVEKRAHHSNCSVCTRPTLLLTDKVCSEGRTH